MIKFNSIGQIEKTYCFEDAVVDKDVLNGDFGTVSDGAFAVGADATKAIMVDEVGDDMGMDEYKIPAGSHVRVLDLLELAKQHPKNAKVEIYGAQLPASFNVGDKLKSDTTGKLVTGATVAPYFEVTAIIGNKLGAEVKIVTA